VAREKVARIDDLLRKDDINGLHTAIRDAALFGDKTCDKYKKGIHYES
jgi:hypothetical protein